MAIAGIGNDIVEISRIEEMITRHGDHFLQRIFTAHEISYCSSNKNAVQHYAGRWAVKEAVMKVLGTGFIKGIHWTDIEVKSEQSGRPILKLSGTTADYAQSLGMETIHISISHGKEYAVAVAIAESAD